MISYLGDKSSNDNHERGESEHDEGEFPVVGEGDDEAGEELSGVLNEQRHLITDALLYTLQVTEIINVSNNMRANLSA